MKKCYIISRYRAKDKRELKFNIDVARYFAREMFSEDKLPVVPHIYFTQFLDDSDEDERECGIMLGIHTLRYCDEFLLVIIDGVISNGMAAEIKEISRLGIPGRIVCLKKREMIERMKTVV